MGDSKRIDIEFVDADGVDQILEVVREVFRTRPKVRYNWIIRDFPLKVIHRIDNEVRLMKKFERMLSDLFAVREVLTPENWVVRVVANQETATVEVMLGYYNDPMPECSVPSGFNWWHWVIVSRLKKGGYILANWEPGKINKFPKVWSAVLGEIESGELSDDYV